MKELILIGFGGHERSVADAIEQTGEYQIVGYTEQKPVETCQKYLWLGTDDCLQQYYLQGIRYACICLGYLGKGNRRDQLYAELKKIGFVLPVIIDKSAAIGMDVEIGEGTFIGKNAVVNAGSRIGKLCIINSGAVLEHGNSVGDFSHIAVHAVLCGNVHVSDHSFIGANATVLPGSNIGRNVIVGASAFIRETIGDNRMVYDEKTIRTVVRGGVERAPG